MKAPLVMVAAIISLSLAVISCGDAEEETPSDVATTPTATPSPAPISSTAPTPSPVPSASPDAVPADWSTYSDPDGRFSLAYPSTWFLQDGGTSKVRPAGELTSIFSSYQPGTVSEFPASGLKVDLYVRAPVPGSDCRSAPEGATTDTLGDVSGWRRLISETSQGGGRSVVVAAYREGYCYSLTAYFGTANTDDAIFSRIVGAFRFSDSNGGQGTS